LRRRTLADVITTLSRLHRSVGIPPPDLLLSVVLALASTGSILSGEVVEGPRWLTLPVALIAAAAVAVRTRRPLEAATALAVAGLVQALAGTESPGSLMALVATLVVVYTLGAECGEGAASIGLAVVLGSMLLQEWLDHGSDFAFITIEVGGVWLLGRGARSWRARATYAEQHQRDLARLAVAEERTRIARDLHDVVAHSLSVIAVQADAAEASLEVDASRAGTALRAIRGSAREALGDMRQMLYLLRIDDGDEAGDRAPARGVADLTRLVAGMENAGLFVDSRIEIPDDLPSGISLAAYRIAQEGLTNVRRHAGKVPTRLVVARRESDLWVEVHNDPPARGAAAQGKTLSSGFGLIGVRERALATGGDLDAGPTGDGGYALVARLPLRGASR
jgi:signal transduction histidine kinase